jgi:hypothetical protein
MLLKKIFRVVNNITIRKEIEGVNEVIDYTAIVY